MFFWQRKFSEIETRTYRFRNEWGELKTLELIVMRPAPMTDRELQEELRSTVIARTYDG